MGKVVAIANQKGGVGKTTTSVNLSSILARRGKKVLIVDTDPQGNATSGLGIEKELEYSVYDVIVNEIDMDKTIKNTNIKNLKICPSNINLAGAEVELVSMISREQRLKERLGLTKDQFEKEIASADEISDEERQKVIESGTYAPSYMWNVNGWLCDKLGLTVVSQRQKCVPQFNDYDIESSTLGMTVKAGMATGMSAVVTTKTKEGITLETECIGKVYNKDEFDRNEWTVYGEPNTTLVIEKPNTVELTCATVVNRIPDVIKAEAGFVPTSRMGELKYIKED